MVCFIEMFGGLEDIFAGVKVVVIKASVDLFSYIVIWVRNMNVFFVSVVDDVFWNKVLEMVGENVWFFIVGEDV